MRIHKIVKGGQDFGHTLCGKFLRIEGGRGHYNWRNVTCKNCLQKGAILESEEKR